MLLDSAALRTQIETVFADREAVLNGTSDEIFARGLCLPSGSSLTDAQQDEVIAAPGANRSRQLP